MMLKIAGVILCEILVYALLKQYKPEFAVISEAVAMVIVFFMLGNEVRDALGEFSSFMKEGSVSSEYIGVLIKVLGIALVTQFTSDMCRDSGENALASKVEFAGKVIITAASIPVIKGFTGFVASLVENV